MRATRIVVSSRGHQITRPSRGEIQLDITLEADVEYGHQREHLLGTYRMIWSEIEGRWLLTGMETLDIIQHPRDLN
jgi:hypothetical protein